MIVTILLLVNNYGNYFVTIGERLKLERLRLGLTQPQLAAIGLTTKKSQIDYEQGNSYPKASYLAAVSQFGVDVNYIITGERSAANPLTKALVDAFYNADDITQQMIAKLLGFELDALKELPHVIPNTVGDNNIINSPHSGNTLKIKLDKKRDK